MRTISLIALAVGSSACAWLPKVAVAAGEEPTRSAEQILEAYAADFRHDPAAAQAVTFGIRITGAQGGDWHVVVGGRGPQVGHSEPAETSASSNEPATASKAAQGWDVTLKPGFPIEPIAFYVLDLATLRKLDAGELNALTAMAKAHGGETAPLEVDVTPGFESPADFWASFAPLSFHFWTRGLPERVPFRSELGRTVHGANAIVFYYQRGFRSAWFQVTKGRHVNEDPKDQTNPFPSMFIMLGGKLEVRIGGKQQTFPAGEMMFVPPGVTHEFWNPYDAPAEMIALMFGEGA